MVPAAGGDDRALIAGPGGHGQVEWSPDGDRLVFVSNRNGTPDVRVTSRDGGRDVALTEGPGNDQRPRWSPDGRWVAFRSIRDDRADIWIAPADGGAARRVTDDPAEEGFPRWSPDGSALVFSIASSRTCPRTGRRSRTSRAVREPST